jgi:hypothetical protein
MLGRKNEFASLQFDLIQNPDDLDVLYQLNDASRAQLASRIDPGQKRTLAHRLVLSISLRSASARFLGKFPMPSIRAEVVPAQQAAGEPAVVDLSAGLGNQVPGTARGPEAEAGAVRSNAQDGATEDRAELVLVLRKLKARAR